MKSDTVKRLQDWYISNCDGDWEHSFGVTVGTLDNPGWSVSINLDETPLEEIKFDEYSYGVGDAAEEGGDNWIVCRVTDSVFEGRGGPAKLDEILTRFLVWAEGNTPSPQ